jgi:hypothetical protein
VWLVNGSAKEVKTINNARDPFISSVSHRVSQTTLGPQLLGYLDLSVFTIKSWEPGHLDFDIVSLGNKQ